MPHREDIARLAAPGSIGVELGVATGQFSRRLLETGRFSVLYSIDAWGDGRHNAVEMALATAALAGYGAASKIIRARFDQAVHQFDDGFFDFIYIDGYAHTGQENGQTLEEWWSKLKTGGVFAGDDYSRSWPHTIRAVDAFVEKHNLDLHIFKFDGPRDRVWDQSPSWYVIKP